VPEIAELGINWHRLRPDRGGGADADSRRVRRATPRQKSSGAWFQSRGRSRPAAWLWCGRAGRLHPRREAIANWLNSTRSSPGSTAASPSPRLSGRSASASALACRQAGRRPGEGTWKIRVPRPGQPGPRSLPERPPQGEVTLVYNLAQALKESGQPGAVLITGSTGRWTPNFFGRCSGPESSLEMTVTATRLLDSGNRTPSSSPTPPGNFPRRDFAPRDEHPHLRRQQARSSPRATSPKPSARDRDLPS